MKFKDLIKKFLKFKKTETYTLVNLRDTLDLPDKDNLSSEDTSLLQEYIKEYLVLLRNRIIFSKDLDITRLTTEKDMTMALIDNLFRHEDVDYFDYLDENQELKMIIKARKKVLYLNHILKMKREIELRLLALEEILETRKHLSSPKINAIINKCKNLTCTLYTFKCTGEALGVDVMASLKEIELGNTSILKEDIELKKAQLLEFIKFIFPDKYDEYVSKNYSNDYEMLAFLESELEKYVYHNTHQVESFCEAIEDLASTCSSLDTDALFTLEMQFKIFSLYGYNLISKDLIGILYYNIFFWSINKLDEVNFVKLNYAQMECYDKLIMRQIERIMMNENDILTTNYGIKPKDIAIGAKIISKILKGENGVYSTYDILNDKKLLSFLFLYNTSTFFNYYKVNTSDYNFPQNSGFKWSETVPLLTICELNSCGYLKDKDSFYELYELIKSMFESDFIYKLPEGLEVIHVGLDYIDADEKLIDEITKKSKNNTVYTPSSFRTMTGWFDIKCNTLYLNDGVDAVSEFIADSNMCINIPSSIRVLYLSFTAESRLDGIIFRDYLESQVLTNHRSLLLLLQKIFYIEKFEVDNPKDEVYKTIGSKEISDRVYKVNPRFNVLVFENGKEKISVEKEDFKYIVYRKKEDFEKSVFNKNSLAVDELEELTAYVESILFKKDNFRRVRRR